MDINNLLNPEPAPKANVIAFQPKAPDPTVVFANVCENDVKWVTGRGQWVEWKECIGVPVFKNGGQPQVLTQNTGQVKLEAGFELYMTWGKVKEV